MKCIWRIGSFAERKNPTWSTQGGRWPIKLGYAHLPGEQDHFVLLVERVQGTHGADVNTLLPLARCSPRWWEIKLFGAYGMRTDKVKNLLERLVMFITLTTVIGRVEREYRHPSHHVRKMQRVIWMRRVKTYECPWVFAASWWEAQWSGFETEDERLPYIWIISVSLGWNDPHRGGGPPHFDVTRGKATGTFSMVVHMVLFQKTGRPNQHRMPSSRYLSSRRDVEVEINTTSCLIYQMTPFCPLPGNAPHVYSLREYIQLFFAASWV